ncbi:MULTISPECIES: DUF3037 domain-containing protein [Pseudomonas]|uniref:DUF3037 domain-containing protein n=1 Tax=Pseudomonas TaxID=286 RepID=UPI0028995FE8|nr:MULTISPECIES: DUF3037 domain-containing protein [Pseudomonas]
MTHFCNYSILRFLPYPETGEFVNIGIVLLASNGEFRYQIETKRQRVTNFFYRLDSKIFIRARAEIEQELARLSGFFSQCRDQQATQLAMFRNLIQPRETMMRFSSPGTIAAEKVDEAVKSLFDHYVNLSFASKQYEEKTLEKQLGHLLAEANLKQRYKEQRLGTDDYPVKFPYVLLDKDGAAQAIKPIHLGHDEPAKILDHGDAWLAKVRRLQKNRRLARDTLFITSPPNRSKTKLVAAYKDIVSQLSDLESVRVISNELSESQVLNEIRQGIPESLH